MRTVHHVLQERHKANCILIASLVNNTNFIAGLAGLRWHIVRTVHHVLQERHKANCILIASLVNNTNFIAGLAGLRWHIVRTVPPRAPGAAQGQLHPDRLTS